MWGSWGSAREEKIALRRADVGEAGRKKRVHRSLSRAGVGNLWGGWAQARAVQEELPAWEQPQEPRGWKQCCRGLGGGTWLQRVTRARDGGLEGEIANKPVWKHLVRKKERSKCREQGVC